MNDSSSKELSGDALVEVTLVTGMARSNSGDRGRHGADGWYSVACMTAFPRQGIHSAQFEGHSLQRREITEPGLPCEARGDKSLFAQKLAARADSRPRGPDRPCDASGTRQGDDLGLSRGVVPWNYCAMPSVIAMTR